MDSQVAPSTLESAAQSTVAVVGLSRGWVRWLVSAAVTIGVSLGAMSCVAGMALGNGHDTHVGGGHLRANAGQGVHGQHMSTGRDDAGVASPVHSDEQDQTSVAGERHPGMACVTSVRLRQPDLFVSVDIRVSMVPPMAEPPECVSGPEPPVPRFS